MKIKRHFKFLKAVFLYTITSFGGAQGHLAMMLKTFVDERKDITEKELIEYNAFCQMLPGASSSQIVMLIGYKRGGVLLSVLTLLTWVLPACIFMGLFSFFIKYFDAGSLHTREIFKYVKPMAIGFILYSAINLSKISIHNTITRVILIVTILLTYLFFHSPWIFPAVILCGGIVTNFSKKRIIQTETPPKKIKWGNILIFFAVFIIAGFLSETARKNNWKYRAEFNLFENFYRFGSLTFGGGDVLAPIMYEQYVVRPQTPRMIAKKDSVLNMQKDEFLTGYGMLKAIPGPTFSLSTYIGGMVMKKNGNAAQIMGCLIAGFSVFLPSTLLVLFFFPVWNNLKKYAVIYRSLEGINAVVVGIIFASSLYLLKDISIDITSGKIEHIINIITILSTFCLLKYAKLKSPYIVLICLILGIIF